MCEVVPFNFVVCSVEEANYVGELSIDELQSSLLVHEQKIKHQEIEEQALKAFSENNSTPNGAIKGEVEEEVEVEKADTTMIMGINNNIIGIKRVNFKEEAEDVAATTQQLIAQSQQTSPMLNVTDVIGMAIISQNVKLI